MTNERDPMKSDPMTERDTERLLAEWFQEEAPKHEPPVLLPTVLARTAMTRQRPKWLTRDWWLSLFGPVDRRPPPMMMSLGFVAVLTALTLAAAIVLVPGGDGDDDERELPPGALVVAADGTGDYLSIGAAEADAEDGDIIAIMPGEYSEAVETVKSLTFMGGGEPADVIIRPSLVSVPAVFSEGHRTVLEGLTFDLTDAGSCGFSTGWLPADAGPGTPDPSTLTIRGSIFRGAGDSSTGICGASAESVVIEGSTFEGLDVGLQGVAYPFDVRSSLFRQNRTGLKAEGDVRVRDSRFVGNELGVNSSHGGERNDFLLSANDFQENATAVRFSDPGHFEVLGNAFVGDQVGVQFVDGPWGSIDDNDFSDIATVAIHTDSSGPVVQRNTITGGADGIKVTNADPWLMGNSMSGVGGTAIEVGLQSMPKVVGNKFCDNSVDLDLAEGAGSTIGGNPVCTDAEVRSWEVAPDGSRDFATIGAAVEAANSGDSIDVYPGVYDESIVVGKDISITGVGERSEVVLEVSAPFPRPRDDASMDRLRYDDPPFAFWIVESDVAIDNMTIRGRSSTVIVAGGAPVLSNLEIDGLGIVFHPPGHDLIPFMGLAFEANSSGQLRDSIIKDTEVLLWGGADVLVEGNSIQGGAITIEDAGTDAIVRGNRLENSNKWAIGIWNGASPLVSDNDIVGAETGIDVYGVTTPTIEMNVISDEQGRVDMVARADAGNLPDVLTSAEIAGNRIRESSGPGIGIHEYASALITANEVTHNEVGILLVRPKSVSLADNIVCDNGRNVVAGDEVLRSVDEDNRICEDAPGE